MIRAHHKLLALSLFGLILVFSLAHSTFVNPRMQVAQVALSTGLLGPYSYSGTLVNIGSGPEVDNLEAQGNGGMSVAFWITTNASANSSIITKGMAANLSGSWQINRSTNTVPNRISFIKEGATDLNSLRNTAIPVGTRTHVVLTYDGSMLKSGVKFYINGTLLPDAGGGADGATANSDAASDLIIGGGNATTQLDGTLEDVRIYNRILTADEIAQLSGNTGGSTGGSGTSTTTTTNPPPSSNPPPSTGVTAVNGVYTVNAAGGTNVFTTITACANVVKAGETCLVQAGTYPERVYPVNSGVAGSPITFKASGTVVVSQFDIGKPYVVIDGFEVTGAAVNVSGITLTGSTGSRVINNYIHDLTGNAHGILLSGSDNVEVAYNRVTRVGGVGIRGSSSSLSNHVRFHDNDISWCGYLGNNKMASCSGMQPVGSHNLVENNVFSHVTDFITYGASDHLVIRNNTFHDVVDADTDLGPHIDGVQGWGNYVLVENNTMNNVHELGGNAHFVLFANDWAPTHNLPDSADAIIRYNTVSDIDSAFAITQYAFKRARYYNNTVSHINGKANGLTIAFTNASTDGKGFNNIFSDAVGQSYLSSYYTTSDSFPGTFMDYDLNWKPSCGTTCGVWNTRSPYVVTPGSETHAIFNKDPLFVSSSNFNLQQTSPAIDKGGPIAHVVSGSGSTITVDDAGMFQDGWAGIQPDWIAVGNPSNRAQISSINYSTNTITLTSGIGATAGDGVYLYKDSSGRQVLYGNAPDMGAYESTYTGTPTPTQTLVGDFDNSGTVNSADWSYMNSKWGTNDPTADLNHDGKVNTLDFGILVKNWTN